MVINISSNEELMSSTDDELSRTLWASLVRTLNALNATCI